jgi:hypothetical protein
LNDTYSKNFITREKSIENLKKLSHYLYRTYLIRSFLKALNCALDGKTFAWIRQATCSPNDPQIYGSRRTLLIKTVN